MWDLIVSIPDNCLSFYFAYLVVVFSSGESFIPNTKTLSGKALKLCICYYNF